MSLADRMDGTYEPPILTEPQGGPIPESTDVQAAAADPGAQRLQDQWDAAKARLLARWPKIAGSLVDELVQQAEAAAAAGDLALLAELRASAGVVAAVAVPLAKSGTDLALEAAAGVVEEAAAQGAEIDAPNELAADQIVKRADVVARIIANGYASGAAKTALQLAGATPDEVRDEVERHLTDLGQSANGLVGSEIAGLLSAAQFAGRLAVLEQHPAGSYVAVEVLDKARCSACGKVAGTRYDTLAAGLVDYPGSGHMRRCEGRARCRGYLRPQWARSPVADGTVMAHLPGKHDQGKHGNRFHISGDRASGIRHEGKERRTPRTSATTKTDHRRAEPDVSAQRRKQDFGRWKAQAEKPNVRMEGGTTQRKQRIAELQAEVDAAVVRRDELVASETEKLKRKRLSAARKAELVKDATAQADFEVKHALSLVKSVRDLPADPGYLDKVIDGKPALINKIDDNNPLAVYGDMLHIEDESDVAHHHLTELDTVPAAWHAAYATYAASTTSGKPGGLFIGDKSVPDLDDMGHLRGVQPRGWPAGSTWSQVPGAANPVARKIMMGGGGHGHGSTSLALHEFGHGADSAMGAVSGDASASESSAWQSLHARIAQVPAVSPYYKQPGQAGRQEAWAEAFAGWSKGRGAGRAQQTAGVVKALNVDEILAGEIASYYEQLQQRFEQNLAV